MAYRRSITSSHSSDNTPKHQSTTSDSSVSFPSGTSDKYEWIWDSTRRAERLPQTPTPEESFEDDEENIHPADVEWGEPVTEDEEDHEEPYEEVRNQAYSDEELEEVMRKFDAQSSYSGPPGFRAGSSAGAALQHDLNVARLRIEQLEGIVDDREVRYEAVEAVNEELAERVAELSVGYVMMGMGNDAADGVVMGIWMAVATLLVLVVALLVRAW